jgi:hypothetical protein
VHLAACHRRDAGQLLAVEQHEAASDAIDGGYIGVVQQVVGEPPVVLLAEGRSFAMGGVRQGQWWVELAGSGPAVGDFTAQRGWAGQQPLVDVGLSELAELDAFAAQPLQQRDRGPQAQLRVSSGRGRGWPMRAPCSLPTTSFRRATNGWPISSAPSPTCSRGSRRRTHDDRLCHVADPAPRPSTPRR